MVVLTHKLNTHIECFERLSWLEKQLKSSHSEHSKQPSLLQAVMEGFVDGVLILSNQGEFVHANDCARRIFSRLLQGASQTSPLIKEVWRVYDCLLESKDIFYDQKLIIESEIDADNLGTFRIRARWLVLEESAHPYLLITIEDRQQSTQNVAITDAKRYGLTAREAEVWLLRRANHSYKEIADRLYITLNTVKKHIKNIHAKQEADLWAEENFSSVTLRNTK
ncbi:MAG: helix-turn-helix transcriptional regulator [Microcoleus sp. SIO2G3]|nr:helix-turn-helix transcriptional regulator [Microcoleus sp. SIO2G3]